MEIFLGHKKYILNDENLLCEVNVIKDDLMMDIDQHTLRLYWCKKNTFVLDEFYKAKEKHETPILMNKAEAQAFTDKYPFDVNKDVYIKAFGEPSEI